jgi:hypothetical protein
VRRIDCSSSPSGEPRSTSWCCMPRPCGSRSSRWRAGR